MKRWLGRWEKAMASEWSWRSCWWSPGWQECWGLLPGSKGFQQNCGQNVAWILACMLECMNVAWSHLDGTKFILGVLLINCLQGSIFSEIHRFQAHKLENFVTCIQSCSHHYIHHRDHFRHLQKLPSALFKSAPPHLLVCFPVLGFALIWVLHESNNVVSIFHVTSVPLRAIHVPAWVKGPLLFIAG